MMIGDTLSDDAVQFLTLALSLLGIVLWVVLAKRIGRRWGYTIAPITFLGHRALYYIVITLDQSMSTAQRVTWSAAISLHSVITLLVGAVVMIRYLRRRNT